MSTGRTTRGCYAATISIQCKYYICTHIYQQGARRVAGRQRPPMRDPGDAQQFSARVVCERLASLRPGKTVSKEKKTSKKSASRLFAPVTHSQSSPIKGLDIAIKPGH